MRFFRRSGAADLGNAIWMGDADDVVASTRGSPYDQPRSQVVMEATSLMIFAKRVGYLAWYSWIDPLFHGDTSEEG
jgi:hypothetical protein